MPITALTAVIVSRMLISPFRRRILKAHYPTYFYAAVLSNESHDTAKIYKYSNELRSAGLKFLPPDINESDLGFTPLENAVRFGLSAIKGIGNTSVKAIIEARKRGRYTSLHDFTARVEQGAVTRRGLESLIFAGAFDSLKSGIEITYINGGQDLFALAGGALITRSKNMER